MTQKPTESEKKTLQRGESHRTGPTPGESSQREVVPVHQLQRTVGNQVVGRLIQASRSADRGERAGARFSPETGRGLLKAPRRSAAPASLAVQRDPSDFTVPDSLKLKTGPTSVMDGPMSVMDAPGNQAPAQHPASAPLSKDERSELIRLTGNRITRAFVAFTQAVEQNRTAVKAAASDSSGFLELVLEIALGVLLPAVSKGIAHLAEELPVNASNFRYKVALQAMKEEQTTKLLETGVKVGKELLKGEASSLAGENEMDAFLGSLEDKFNKTADQIDQGLPSLSDEALGVTAAAYDPSVASREQFRAAVKDLVDKYQKQIKRIGTDESHWMNESSTFSLYYVVSPNGSKRLALLENGDLKTWISPELAETAIEKFKSMPVGHYYGGKVPEIPAANVGKLAG